MIYINGAPFSTESSNQDDMLLALMEHPVLKSASTLLNAIPERNFTVPEDSSSETPTQSKCVYVFQREYAIVDPALVDFVGTDEATTCVGIAIRHRATGMTTVAHMDSPKVVDIGLSQMLSSFSEHDSETNLDVHLLGGFDDVSPQFMQNDDYLTSSQSNSEAGGHSFPLCAKIVETLQKSSKKFHLHTLHVLRHNTKWDSEGNATPIFHGFLAETSTGSIIPTSFDRTSRCPHELVRRIRLTSSFENPRCRGRLLETYETRSDRFVIDPFIWTKHLVRFALSVQELSDKELLLYCSTSPLAEGADFVQNERRLFDYLIQNPDWRDTFPAMQPHIFERTKNNTWIRKITQPADLMLKNAAALVYQEIGTNGSNV